jgi:serine/threonine-protein kinase
MASINLTEELINHFGVSDYEVAKSGGQKNVFIVKIEDIKYALKLIKIADERFKREVKICEEFNDYAGIPTIIRVEQFGEDTIILEEYIEGADLNELINNYQGKEKNVIDLIRSIGIILAPVWQARYVHRDLKPQNVRIRKDGTPVILDFGIARALDDESITATGAQPLTWLYAAPEQYAGKKRLISYRTDFFSLGIIAYELYTNKLPFGSNRDLIEESFNSGYLQVRSGSSKIDKFCNAVFKVNPSERPKNIENLFKLL